MAEWYFINRYRMANYLNSLHDIRSIMKFWNIPRNIHIIHAFSCFVVVMMTSSNGIIFRVTGLLCGRFTSHRWITRTKASDEETLMFSLIWAWTNSWVNRKCYCGHYDDIVMFFISCFYTYLSGLSNRHWGNHNYTIIYNLIYLSTQ